MKKVVVGLCALLLLMVHLAMDDELNPQAQQWIEHFSQPPNLERNAYIELIALTTAVDSTLASTLDSTMSM